jgi:hypothetical protein
MRVEPHQLTELEAQNIDDPDENIVADTAVEGISRTVASDDVVEGVAGASDRSSAQEGQSF